jgi:L-alanine-DL-glutamate epimerase-like enolase superfamily enzyme
VTRAGGAEIAAVDARPFRAELAESFEIAGGAAHVHEGVFVRVRLRDGTAGWGEASPMAAFNGETPAGALSAARRAGRRWLGRDGAAWRARLTELEEALPRGAGAARAALGMALLDAWTRRCGLPLRALFGGAQTRVTSDVTVTIVPPEAAERAARRIRALGVRAIKIKVGKDPADDAARVAAVAAVDPRFTLTLDANQGYGPRQSLDLLRRLRARGIRPALFEQPAAADDWDGLARVARLGRVPVAADESVRGRADAWGLARRGAVQVLNVKLMKMGLLEAWDVALIARACGLGLMIGGMIETSLAMGCAAHFAAGLGGFRFVDLDTPLWLRRDPTRGLRLARGGVYDLSRVRAGIGVEPDFRRESAAATA